jgi:hypothetical protein
MSHHLSRIDLVSEPVFDARCVHEGPMECRAMKTLLVAGLGLALGVATEATNAAVVRWELENVTFEDGGTASGFFLYDSARFGPPLVDWDITLAGGTAAWPFPPYRFTTDSATGFSVFEQTQSLAFRSNESFDDSGDQNFLELNFSLDRLLSDGGETRSLRGNVVLTDRGDTRALRTGVLQVIPEASSFVFLASVLLAVAAWGSAIQLLRTNWPCPLRYAAGGRRGSDGSCRETLRRDDRPDTVRRRLRAA